MTARELFLEKTHIDSDYFLLEVLKVLGQYETTDNLGKGSSSTMFPLNDKGERVGIIKTTNYSMHIEALSKKSKLRQAYETNT